jgi:hypothetical protein
MPAARARRLLVGLAATAACLPVAPAAAATYVLRPSTTYPISSTWTTSPAGADLAGVLDDVVTRPAAPSTFDDYVQHTGAASAQWVSTYLAAPTLAAGETPTAARLYVYAQVGTQSTLTFTLWAGYHYIGYTSVPAGSPAGWYSATATVAPTATTAGQLAMTLRVDAGWGATATRVYAAVAELDTEAAPAGATNGPGDGPGTPPASDTPRATDMPTLDGPSGSTAPGGSSAAAPPAVQIDLSAPIVLPARAQAVPLPLGCPATAVGGCRGTVVLRVAGKAAVGRPAKARRRRARAARCARGCRVIGEGRFDVAAGKRKKVPVKIAKAARNLFAAGRTVRATAVVTTRDAAGRTTVVTKPVSIQRTG